MEEPFSPFLGTNVIPVLKQPQTIKLLCPFWPISRSSRTKLKWMDFMLSRACMLLSKEFAWQCSVQNGLCIKQQFCWQPLLLYLVLTNYCHHECHQRVIIVMMKCSACRCNTIIQVLLKTRFEHSTLLHFAHLPDTVIDSDRVMVSVDGQTQQLWWA